MHGLVTGQDPRRRRGDLELKLENPLGFFESERLVEINDGLLDALGCQWDHPPLLPASWDKPPLLDRLQAQRSLLSTYALNNKWVDKDPRLCITYPAYLHILLRRIPLVVALREPLAVATSLYSRNGFSFNRGLLLWWIYNHHIASQLSPADLLIPYSSMLMLDDQGLNCLFGPFLELHNHQRPSGDHARMLVMSILKPEFNRAEFALNAQAHNRIHPMLLKASNNAYKSIMNSSDKLSSFKEHFDSIPRVILECSMRDLLVPEAEIRQYRTRLIHMESEINNLSSSLEQRDQECSLLRSQLRDLQSSRSWKITAPLRAFVHLLRSAAD